MEIKKMTTLNKKLFIKREVLEPIISQLNPGEQKKFHHCKQGNGNDRMYVKKLEDGSGLIAFCHHCGQKGVLFNIVTGPEAKYKLNLTDPSDANIRHHYGTSVAWEEFNWEEIVNSYEASIPEDRSITALPIGRYLNNNCGFLVKDSRDLAKSGHFIKVASNALYVPIGTRDNISGKGFKKRIFSASWKGPKWLTKAVGPNDYIYKGDMRAQILVLVEDSFSALRVIEATGCSSLWLGGTTLHPSQIRSISEFDPQSILVFLDNDNGTVIANALKMHGKLINLGFPVVGIVKANDKDPKAYSNMELEVFISEYL